MLRNSLALEDIKTKEINEKQHFWTLEIIAGTVQG
mgnify:CR=1 FL=1